MRFTQGTSDAWSNSFLDEDQDVSIVESNYLGTMIGLVLGVLTLGMALLAMFRTDLCPIGCGKRSPNLEKAWLVFTTLQGAWFLGANIGKVITLCKDDSVIPEEEKEEMRTTQGNEAAGAYVWAVSHCRILQIWYTEWVILATFVVSMFIWAAFSFINGRIITAREEYEEDSDDWRPQVYSFAHDVS